MSLEYVAHHMPPCFRQEPVLKAVSLLVAPRCPADQSETTALLKGVGEVVVHYMDDSENGPIIVSVWAGPCDITGLVSSYEDELYASIDAQLAADEESAQEDWVDA